MPRLPRRGSDALGDNRLRSALALGFPDMPAVVRRLEFSADALPADAGVEDDMVAIDQVFATWDGSGSQRNGSIGDLCTRISTRRLPARAD